MTLAPLLALALLVQDPAAGTSESTDPVRHALAFVRAHRSADAALVAGDLESARAGFEAALALEPDHPTILEGLAAVASRAGDLDAAEAWLGRALEAGYDDAAVLRWDPDLEALRARTSVRARIEALGADAARRPKVRVEIESTRWVVDLAVDPGRGPTLLGLGGGELALLDTRTGEVRSTWDTGDAELWAVALSPSGDRCASLDHDGWLGIWRLPDGEPIARVRTLDEHSAVLNAARELADGTAELDEAHKATLRRELPFGAALAFDPTGARLVAAASDRGGGLWTADGEPVRRWDEPLGDPFHLALDWSPDGELLVWSRGPDLRRVRAEDGADLPPLSLDNGGAEGADEAWVSCLAFSPRTGRLTTGHGNGELRTWDRDDWTVASVLRPDRNRAEAEFGMWWTYDEPSVSSLAHDPRSNRVAFTLANPLHAFVHDLESGELLWVSEFGGGRMGERTPIAWGSDGAVWWGYDSGLVNLWRAVLGEEPTVRTYGGGRVPAFAADGWAVTSHGLGSVSGLKSGEPRWTTPLPDPTAPRVTEAGYLAWTHDPEFLPTGEVLAGDRDESLLAHWTTLHDPKRVRAAAAGVTVRPADL